MLVLSSTAAIAPSVSTDGRAAASVHGSRSLRETRSRVARPPVAGHAAPRQPGPVSGTLTLERTRLRIRGVVQGVGFRPFVHRLAERHGLAGFVFNDADGVVVEVEGDGEALA